MRGRVRNDCSMAIKLVISKIPMTVANNPYVNEDHL